jgi:hypothetical protein
MDRALGWNYFGESVKSGAIPRAEDHAREVHK